MAILTQRTGLTSAEAAARIARGEGNAVKPYVERTYWRIIADNIFNLFNIVLLVLLVILLFFQDYTAIIFASFSVIANSLIGTIQEISAKRRQVKIVKMCGIRGYYRMPARAGHNRQVPPLHLGQLEYFHEIQVILHIPESYHPRLAKSRIHDMIVVS